MLVCWSNVIYEDRRFVSLWNLKPGTRKCISTSQRKFKNNWEKFILAHFWNDFALLLGRYFRMELNFKSNLGNKRFRCTVNSIANILVCCPPFSVVICWNNCYFIFLSSSYCGRSFLSPNSNGCSSKLLIHYNVQYYRKQGWIDKYLRTGLFILKHLHQLQQCEYHTTFMTHFLFHPN